MSAGRDVDADQDDGRNCGNCGVRLGRFGGGTEMLPMTDGLGVYYMARVCRNCSTVLVRYYPGEGRSLRDDLRTQAVRDPNPPARTEMPDAVVDPDDRGDDVGARGA